MFQGKFRHKRKRLSEFAMKNNNVFEKMRLRKKKRAKSASMNLVLVI